MGRKLDKVIFPNTDYIEINPPTKSLCGNIVSFPDGASAPMPSLKVGIEPIQEGSGDPSPTNVRPISGHTEANVTVSPLNISQLYNGQIYGDGSWVSSNMRLTNATSTQDNSYFLKAGTYTLDYDKLNSNAPNLLQCSALTKDGNYTIIDNFANKWNSVPFTFTLTQDGYFYFTIRKDADTNINPSDYRAKILGQTYTIQFRDGDNPLTVYGGSLDVVSGVLTVDRAYMDLGTLNWFAGYGGFIVALNDIAPWTLNTQAPTTLICSAYPTMAYSVSTDMSLSRVASTTYIRIIDSRYTDPSAFKTAMSGVQLVYELATPITYQLTPTQVKSLLGSNNVWADCGDVCVTYVTQEYQDLTVNFATTASKLGSSNVGSATQPIYLSAGTATACTYTLGKSVPSDAVFTDHYAWTDITGKPTTISGYGITDAKIASGTITLGSNTITPLTSSSTLNAAKLSGTIPSSCYTDTNNAVTQTATDTTDATYELLFSCTADNTTHTEGARKSKYATFNPSKKAFTFGTRLENSTIGGMSYAQGENITASGAYSYASGNRTTASGSYSHAEGSFTTASENYSHAEGYYTTASGFYSHAEGSNTTASDYASHAEGHYTTASGSYSHAEGFNTTASGDFSHSEGSNTTANHKSQHVFGEYNISDDSSASSTERGNYIEIVGKGDSDTPSNARTLDWDGNEWLAGTLTTTDVINSAKWDGTNTSLKTAVTDKLSKSSGTTIDNPISGSIAVTGSYYSKAPSVDMSKSNNNLSSDYYGLVDFRDKNKKRFGYIQFSARAAGGTDASLRAVNYASGGTTTEYTNTLTLVTSKTGAYTYSVSSAANFRSAIGAAASSSIKTKENISDLTEDEALKLLKIRPVSFDYKQGFDIDNKYERNYGVIAEETINIIPSVVNIPTTEGYEFDETKGTNQELITVDYAKFVPYLIKLVQMQQQEIDELKNR